MIANSSKIKKTSPKNLKKVALSFVWAGLILGIIAFLATSNFKVSQKRSKLQDQIGSLEKEIQLLEQRNKEMSLQISENSREDFVEREAREKLNFQKPGENVVVVLPPKEDPTKIEPQKTLWQKFLEMLKF